MSGPAPLPERPAPPARPRFAAALTAWLALLAAAVVLHEFTTLDFLIQDPLYNAARGGWFVDAASPLPRLFFYDLPKFGLIGLGAVLGVRLIAHRIRHLPDTPAARAAWMVVLCMVLVPVVVGALKSNTGIACPGSLARYSGSEPFRRLFDPRPAGVKLGRCFPAGHASLGFAMLSLFYLPVPRRRRVALGLAGLAIAVAMATYQTFKGAHFFTHSLTTLALAGAITLIVARTLGLPGGPRHAVVA